VIWLIFGVLTPLPTYFSYTWYFGDDFWYKFSIVQHVQWQILSDDMSSLRFIHIWLGARVAQWIRSLDLTTHTSLSPIRRELNNTLWPYLRLVPDFMNIVNFMSCNTVKTCACLIQGKIFGGIIEIYHACKWYLPKNTGWETKRLSILRLLCCIMRNRNLQLEGTKCILIQHRNVYYCFIQYF
jgi:hypothetical protein